MPWTLEKDSFDFIHARDLLLSVRDWPKLVRQSYEYVFIIPVPAQMLTGVFPSHIRPGGYIELQSVLPKLCCDDGSCPPDSGLMTFSRHALDASEMYVVKLINLQTAPDFAKYTRIFPANLNKTWSSAWCVHPLCRLLDCYWFRRCRWETDKNAQFPMAKREAAQANWCIWESQSVKGNQWHEFTNV
jgi:hypothetical protein